MARTIRHATWRDLLSIVSTRRRQRVLRLNPPYSLVESDGLLRDLWRSQVPTTMKGSFVYTYVEWGVVLGYVQAKPRWRRRDEWTICTLAQTDRAPENVLEGLLEDVCRSAGEQGVMRIFVKVPKDEASLEWFRRLGFTHYTNESIWGNLYFGPSSAPGNEPAYKPLRRALQQDAWDLMKLYSVVTPPAVQRAELLNSRQWQGNRIVRPWPFSGGLVERSYVWPDAAAERVERKGELGGYVRLLTGARGHWISLLFKPDSANRKATSAALDYVLWKAARQGNKPVYCGVRQYQAELSGDIEERGFHPLSEQVLLVKYLAEPVKAREHVLLPFLVPQGREMIASKFSPMDGTAIADGQ